MDFKKIDNILNKYFEGLTSLEEEKNIERIFRFGQHCRRTLSV